ncbi:MAG: DUF1501 domain-containing protein, partial [Verrucomicrobiota bacterium]
MTTSTRRCRPSTNSSAGNSRGRSRDGLVSLGSFFQAKTGELEFIARDQPQDQKGRTGRDDDIGRCAVFGSTGQLNQHNNNLATLAAGLAAFQQDLEAKQLDSQVLTMTFSEFGRRPNENQSRGTDHGTAAPLFVMGTRLKGTLFGTAPMLANLPKNQDLTYCTDFRQIYA